jgi:hypothetical protein
MILTTSIRPSVCKRNYKQDIISNWGLFGYTFSNYGQYYKEDKDFVYAINFEKFNKKTEQRKKKPVNGKCITSSRIIREKHWVGYLYMIPKGWLKSSNKKVMQKSRNFKIIPSKS